MIPQRDQVYTLYGFLLTTSINAGQVKLISDYIIIGLPDVPY